ncbi:MAG: SGNH/GDSL hydrolase family protein [Lachnospiraceae bacterium]|nr:SGNH/GDSL hydrolase family protein [Lachnospiraceae bacterium]
MEHREHTRKNRYNGRVTLLAIMIGFCILAIIEIAFGQAKLKVEKERLALEQENSQAVQELQAEWNSIKNTESASQEETMQQNNSNTTVQQMVDVGAQTGVTVEEPKQSSETQNTAEEQSTDAQPAVEENKEYDMQIVFMGDSILDNDREDGGVASLISQNCNAKVYNMAMGGTTAALLPNEQYNFATWDSRSLLGVVNAIVGNINKDIFDGYRAGEILDECDFSQTDYFVIEYGVNDFLAKIPQSRYLEGGGTLAVDEVHTYTGALEAAVQILQDNFPDAKILLIAPHYCQIFNADAFVGDGYSLDYGYGPLVNYARGCGYVYEQHKKENVIFYNAFEESGIDSETADQYLEDGVHLSKEGRQVYADYASRLILADFYPEE